MTSSFFLGEDIQFLQFLPFVISISVIHPICVFIVLCCFLTLRLKLLTSSYFENLKFLDFALVTDQVIKVFGQVIIFETCDQVIFITYSLKIKRIKFHGFSMKRTGFIVFFMPRVKKPPLVPAVFEKFKKARLG